MSASNPKSPLLELIKARLREFYREPAIIFWVFGFPLLMAVGLGIAFREKPPELPIVAVIAESADEHLAGAVLASQRLDAELLARLEAERALSRARVDVILDLSGETPAYIFDPAQSKSPVAKMVLDNVLQEAAGRANPLEPQETVFSKPGARYIDYLIPGLIGMNLMGSSMWGIGYNLVVARKRRLLRRYAVTPMRRSQFLLSYFYSRLLFLALELGLLVTFGALAFGAVPQGSFLTLLLVAMFGSASFAGVSLIIGSRLENTETANGWMNLVQMPMWVLSGIFFSYERFPEWLHRPIELLPLTSLNNALRAVYNDGAGLFDLGVPLLILASWGSIGFFVALRGFRWQ